MEKVYFNQDGWVCERYPYNIEKIDSCEFLEVSDEDYQKTFSCPSGYAWRVIEGQLTVEPYDERLVRKLQIEARIAQLDTLLKSNDYIGVKIAMGRASIEEYAEEIQQSTEWASEKSQLEQELKELDTPPEDKEEVNV